MQYFLWYCLNATLYEFNNFNIGTVNAIQKKLLLLHEMDEQINTSLLMLLYKFILTSACICLQSSLLFQHGKKIYEDMYYYPPHVSDITGNILIMTRFTHYRLLLASNSNLTNNSQNLGTWKLE